MAMIAARVIRTPLKQQDLEIRIDHFHQVNRRTDMDNVAKTILDALNNVAYSDDRQIKHQSSARHDLRRVLRLWDRPVDVVKPLAECDEYVFVRLRVPEAVRGT